MEIEPGVTRDGSPVAVYLALPPEPQFTPVLDAMPHQACVLDLGCGVGRLANVLACRRHQVTGVDESPAMLAHLDADVEGVEARINQSIALAYADLSQRWTQAELAALYGISQQRIGQISSQLLSTGPSRSMRLALQPPR